MNPGLTWMVAIFWIAGNPDSGAVATRIAMAVEYQRANSRRAILRRSECRFRAPNGRVALRRTNVCLEGSTPPRASSRSVICIDKAGSEIVHASAACPKWPCQRIEWPCQRIEMAKLPKRDLGHQKNLPRRSIKSILPYRMGSVGCRGNRVKCRLHMDPGGNHANQDRRQYG
jgi:hypothetical protein